jgi:hypothetical protein
MKKETLEEVAEKEYPTVHEQYQYDAFIKGAKWQAERMCSEVEDKTLHAMISIMQEYSIIDEASVLQFHKEWIEQNKNK